VALPDGCRHVAVTVDPLGHAEIAQVRLVIGSRGSDDRGPGARGKLDGEAADATGRADGEHDVAR
jgi:hypothetical protein